MAFAASGVSDDLIQMTLLGEALDYAGVSVFVFDEDGNVLAANRKACELTGYVRDRLLELRRGDSADPAWIPHRLREIATYELSSGIVSIRAIDGTLKSCTYRVGETRAAGLPFWIAALWEGEHLRSTIGQRQGWVA